MYQPVVQRTTLIIYNTNMHRLVSKSQSDELTIQVWTVQKFLDHQKEEDSSKLK